MNTRFWQSTTLRRLLVLYVLLVPCAVFAAPMRYELDLSPTINVEGQLSWDHTVNNATFGCAACHERGISDFAPSGTITTPTLTGTFLRNVLKVRFYGDTTNFGTYPDPRSTVTGLQNTGTAKGSYVYPGRTTLSVPLVSQIPLSVEQISLGGAHTCAISNPGSAVCWGFNPDGQLGGNAASTLDSPFPLPVTGFASGVAAISAGNLHTCALTAAGGVVCWGYGADGELGNNTTPFSSPPVPVSGLSSGIASVSAGLGHTCALTTAGGVVCWGFNFYGELGNNTTANSSFPVPVSGLSSGVTAISAGAAHTCALTTPGGVVCWGGEYANFASTNSLVPVPVNGLSSDVIAIAAGGNHTCALSTALGVVCWGENDYGQLGNGTTAYSSVPVPVSGLSSGVTAISAGYYHTCALTTTGGVVCWGENDVGELGDNTTANSSVPVPVNGLSSGVTAVVAGYSHTCALTAGEARCWGDNVAGQLGNQSLGGFSATPITPLSGVTQTSLYSGAFDPTAGLFVSVDNSHHSIGIGSGWPNIVPTYPGGIMSDSYTGTPPASPIDLYDLRSELPSISGHQLASSHFPYYCDPVTGLCESYPYMNPALSLIGGGTVEIDPTAPVNLVGFNDAVFGSFSATSLTAMDSFTVSGGFSGVAAAASIQVQGTLTLGTGGNLFTVTTDDVVFGFGSYTAFLPAGSFKQIGVNSTYSGTVNGSPVQITLTNTSGTTYSYSVAVQNANLTSIMAPSVDLYIGDNAGSGTASPIAQSITLATVPSSIAAGASASVSATSSSGLVVTFSTLTPSICTVSGTTLTAVAAGTCTIAANQAGNGIYASAPQVTQSFQVTLAPQSISFPAIADQAIGNSPLSITVSASSGLPVTVTSTTGSVCSVTGATVTLLGPGTCSLTATQAGNAVYAAAVAVTQSFNVTASQTAQTINFPRIRTKSLRRPTFTAIVSATSGLPVTLTSITSSVCTTNGPQVRLLATGTCTLVASQPGNAQFAPAADVRRSFAVRGNLDE